MQKIRRLFPKTSASANNRQFAKLINCQAVILKQSYGLTIECFFSKEWIYKMKRRTRQTMSRFRMRAVAFVIVFAMAFSAAASMPMDVFAANSGKCGDNLTWSLDESTGTLTISGSGKMTDYYDHYSTPWYEKREKINCLKFSGKITSIGDCAFGECSCLKSLTIPDSIITIGDCAFCDCDGLTSITLPNSVTTIGDGTFDGCDGLKSINIPKSVTSIGGGAFGFCSSLKSITIPSSITKINYYTFRFCTSLQSITIPNSVTSIAEGTFSNCTSLTNIDIPNSVKKIGYAAFISCTGLKNITIPNSVIWIGEDAFSGCTNLKSVSIPKSVTSVGESLFKDCEALSDIYYSGNKQQWSQLLLDENDEYVDLELNYDVKIHFESKISYNHKINRRMVDFLGATFKQLKEYKGKDYIVSDEGWEGGTPVYYDDDYFPLMFIMLEEELYVNNDGIPTPDNTIGFVWYFDNGYAKIDIDSTFSSTDTYKKIKEKTGEEAEYNPEDDSYWLTYANGNYTYQFIWDYGYPDNVDAPDSILVCLNSKPINSGKLGSFNYKTDSWSFANNRISFAEVVSGKLKDYSIPAERYQEVYGKGYVELAKYPKYQEIDVSLFKKETQKIETYYESMIPSSWRGNCDGMAKTAALFNTKVLKWSSYNSNGKFQDVNDYYKDIQSSMLKKYTTAGYGSDVTKLIERYVISKESDLALSNLVDLDYYWNYSCSEDKTENTYSHIKNGTYMKKVLEEIQKSKTPLIVNTAWIRKNNKNENEFAAHVLLAYAWEKETGLTDEEYGWYKIYVYDCNYPYPNNALLKKVSSINSLRDCYSTEQRYIEINIEKNIWRYSNSSVTSESSTDTIGCNEKDEMISKNATVDGIVYHSPDFFEIKSISKKIPQTFNGTEPYITSDGKYSVINGNVVINFANDSKIYINYNQGSNLCTVSDGNIFSTDKSIKVYRNVGNVETEDSFDVSTGGGYIVMPYDNFVIDYESGKDVTIFGPDNVINIGLSGKAKITVDVNQNSLNVTSLTADNQLEIQTSNVHSPNKFKSVYTCGKLSKNGKAQISLDDDEKAKVILDSQATDSFLHVLVSDDQHTSDKYVETVKPGKSKEVIIKKELVDLPGDLNGDGIVNAKDNAILAKAFGKRKGSSGYNEAADFNGDGIINAKDKAIISQNFGKRK